MTQTAQDSNFGPLLSLQEAARYLAIAPRTLRSLVAVGQVSVIKVTGRRIAFSRHDLDQYIESRRRNA